MPCIESWSFKPLDVIESFFDSRKDDKNWIDQVEEYFGKRIENFSILKNIQSLNDVSTHALQSNSLVRFRCMIQETFEPEYYVEALEIIHKTNKTKMLCPTAFRDSIDCSDDYDLVENSLNPNRCRQVLYCVTVPGETSWVKEKHHGHSPSLLSADASSSTTKFGKRSLEEVDDAMDEDVTEDSNKRQKISTSVQGNKSCLSPLKKNHPLPDEDGPVCIVKVYGEDRDFKINEVYEFVGVLSVDPSLAQLSNGFQDNGVDAEMIEEHRAHNPPPSFVPRLHCVHLIKLKHVNPLLRASTSGPPGRPNIRSEIKAFLQKATFGDELAAEYLLLHLVSRVHSRTGSMPVGKFVLNISNIPAATKYSLLLSQFLKHLLTKVFYFPMTLENLNKLNFIPSKNYSSNRLDSGLLQVSEGTNFVVDETVLNPGHLDTNGVKNVQALTNLINFQKVDYNFQFHPLMFEHDVPVLILSNGKSFLPNDCQVPLTPSIDVPNDLENYFENMNPTLPMLDLFRTYFTEMKLLDYELSESMMKVIENDFVIARRDNEEKMTADDLHRHLTIARLFSTTSGLDHLTQEVWESVGRLEMERKQRLKQCVSTN